MSPVRIVRATISARTFVLDGRGAARGRTSRTSLILEIRARTFEDTRCALEAFGEAAPLPGTSRDSLDDARRALEEFAARLPVELACVDDIFAITRQVAETAPSARFAIETALLAALARSRSSTIAELVAGSRLLADSQPVADSRIAASSLYSLPLCAVVDDVDGCRKLLASASRFDLRSIKIKVGPDGDLQRVRSIASSERPTLRLDANQTWPPHSVRDRLAVLADLPIEYIEEPCANSAALLDEAVQLPIPIALDESLVHLDDAAIDRALASPSLGALVLKPTLLGGFTRCLELATRARAAAKHVVITHALESEIGFGACVELARIVGGDCAHGLWPFDREPPTLSHLRSRLPTATVVAQPEMATIEAVRAALVGRRPLALLHHALPDRELERRRRLLDGALADRQPALSHPSPAAELDRLATTAAEDELAFVLFTSGSTGDARGVVLARSAVEAAANASAMHLGWRDDDRWLVALSLAHAGGLAAVVRCELAGKPIALLEGDWDRTQAAALLEHCTLASLVPAQLADLLADPAWRPPRRLRAVLLGGAAASPALLAHAAERGVPFLVTYGMTESFGQLATAPLERAGDPSAPLVPLFGVTLDAGTRARPAPIVVSGPMLAACYLDGTPIAPRFVTADLGFVEDGALHVVGRADDVIVTGGENVHPLTIESVLGATPGVRAACAFGVPDERWGEIVAAAIAADGVDDATLARWHAALPAHARPRELAIVDELPVLATGKLDRRAAARLPRRPVRY